MTTIKQKIRIKNMADARHHMLIKYVFYTLPLLKKNTSEFPVSIILMLISLN